MAKALRCFELSRRRFSSFSLSRTFILFQHTMGGKTSTFSASLTRRGHVGETNL